MIKKLLILIPAIIFASLIAGTQYFAHSVRMAAEAHQSVTAHAPQNTGIVVATGLDGRINAGMIALDQGQAARMLISGVGEGVRKSDIRRIAAVSSPLSEERIDTMLNCCIDLGYAATDTEGNASEARDWAEIHEIDTIIIVTSDFHMPRATIAFMRHFPEDRLIAKPVITPWLRLSDDGFSGWWHSPGRINLMASEMVKYVTRVIIR